MESRLTLPRHEVEGECKIDGVARRFRVQGDQLWLGDGDDWVEFRIFHARPYGRGEKLTCWCQVLGEVPLELPRFPLILRQEFE